jgi:hypothetical protein
MGLLPSRKCCTATATTLALLPPAFPAAARASLAGLNLED